MWKFAATLASALALGACSLGGPSKAARFYALSIHPGQTSAAEPASPSQPLGIGPISLPEMFDRPQIVSRPDANRVVLAEYDRWSGALAEDVERVLVQNLVSRLNNDTVLRWPWQRQGSPALQVAVQFFRFDGEVGRRAYLSGIWQLLDVAGGCRLEVHRFDISLAPAAPGYAGYVNALSLGLARLSDEIAGRVAVSAPGCRAVSQSAETAPGFRTGW
jgi:uncharacterized lipoprotein YmbA